MGKTAKESLAEEIVGGMAGRMNRKSNKNEVKVKETLQSFWPCLLFIFVLSQS